MGKNTYVSLPVADVGTSGAQNSIDLFALAPPNGLSDDLSVICTGQFTGDVSLQGSIDNASWSTICQFNGGSGQTSPVLVDDTAVRYLRMYIRGEILTPVMLTVAGQLNCGCTASSSNTGANWALGITRVYAIDFVNGSDSNLGYADPASSSPADYATACQLAGTRALKTIAGLAAIFPRFGNDRQVEIVIANGGVNTVQSYTDTLSLALAGMNEYATFDCRGTGTNPNAGCVAFDGSLADCTYLGAVTGTGLNANGYNPTGSPTTTTIQFVLNGGGAPNFAAEPAIPCGLRIRGAANTATVALRNVCRTVSKVAGTDTLTWSTALPAVPGSTDVFLIEQAGVSVNGCTLNESLMANAARANFAGINYSAAAIFNNGAWVMAFCQFTSWSESTNQSFTLSTAYSHSVLGNITIGSSRTSSFFSSNRSVLSFQASTQASTGQLTSPYNFTNTGGVTYGSSVTITDPACQTSNTSFGSNSAIVGVGPRILANSLIINGSGTIRIDQLDSSNTASAGIYIGANTYGERLLIDFGSANDNAAITGTNNAVGGMYTTFAKALTVLLNANHPPTITGTFGDLYLSSNIPTSWASVVNSGLGFRENANNQYICVSGSRNGQVISTCKLKFSGTLLGGGAPVFSYLSDDGDVTPGSNNVSPINYPLDGGFVTRILVKPRLNTMTNNCTATVYQNGVATSLAVTIPAGSTATIAAFPAANTVFMFEDLLDLRLDNPSADAGHTLSVSAVVAIS